MPSEQSQGGLTSQIMRTLRPTGANTRSKEIVLAVLVKGHRTGLGVPDPDNTEHDAQEQRDMDPAVETSMGTHVFFSTPFATLLDKRGANGRLNMQQKHDQRGTPMQRAQGCPSSCEAHPASRWH